MNVIWVDSKFSVKIFSVNFFLIFFTGRVGKFLIELDWLRTFNIGLTINEIKFVHIARTQEGKVVPFALVVYSIKLGKS